MKSKQLFFGMSIELPLEEAVLFKKSLGNSERYHLLRVKERPGNVHRDRRVGYVIVRHPYKGERVPTSYRVFADKRKLV
jgi:hypothetical protein